MNNFKKKKSGMLKIRPTKMRLGKLVDFRERKRKMENIIGILMEENWEMHGSNLGLDWNEKLKKKWFTH